MAKYVLEILDGDRAGDVVAIPDRPLRIGRKPGNDLVLADEKTSGQHAEIVPEGDRCLLRDLGSTNGTFLDGKKVTELVLTPGDVVTFGRWRVAFRAEGAAAAAAGADGGEFAVRTLDRSRLGKGSRATGLLAALLVVGLAGGGWMWWQGKQQAGDNGGAVVARREALVVAGDKLAAGVGNCEGEDGWLVRPAGAGFVLGGAANSGASCLEARRGEAADAPDFAVLRSKEPVAVFPQRSLTLAAHVRTEGAAEAALRVVFTTANDQAPFTFRTGTKLAAADGWTRLELVVAAPPGCDRAQIEVVATLPGADAAVFVDDCSLVEAGSAAPIEAKLADGSHAVIGTGSSIAVRCVDKDAPAVALAIVPAQTPPALTGLHKADLCVLSDLGASIAATVGECGFAIAAQGCSALQFVLPAEAASALMIGSKGGVFASTAAASSFRCAAALFGDRLTRALLRVGDEVDCVGRLGGGVYRLDVPVAACDLDVVFRAERQQAAELVRQAKRARDEGRPGEALDKLREVAASTPMDSEVLAQALALVAETMAAQAQTLRDLQRELDEAAFFTTRGGFERVVLALDELVALYGERNLGDAKATMSLRDAARAKLAELDAQTAEQQRTRLQALAQAFAGAQQEGLARLVQDYIRQRLGN
jgi:hypothetical protein